MEKDTKLKNFIKTTIREFLNENVEQIGMDFLNATKNLTTEERNKLIKLSLNVKDKAIKGGFPIYANLRNYRWGDVIEIVVKHYHDNPENTIENKFVNSLEYKKERGVKITDKLEFDVTTGGYDGSWDESTVSIYKYFDIIEYLNEGLNEIIMRPPFEPKHDSSPNMDSFEKIIKHSFEDAKNNGKKIDSINIGFTNYIYNLNKPDMHDNYRLFILNEKSIPILYLGFYDYLDGFKIGTISSTLESRGKELAFKIYVGLSKKFKKPIYSDSTQTESSRFGIWQKLIKTFPNNVVGFDQKNKEDLKLSFKNGEINVKDKEPIYVTKKQLNKFNDWDRTRLLKLKPIS
jgi:hypothetical protein